MEEQAKDMVNYPQPEGIKMDRETLQSYMPKGFNGRITDEVLEMINNVERDTGMSEELFSEQLCSYSHLITGGAGIEKLTNAIKYVNLRMLPKMGSARAYRIVFPGKTVEVEGRGETIDSFASMYSKTKMVVEIQKLLLVPAHISHAPMHNLMLQKLFDLSNGIGAKADDRVSPTVQMNAATELLNATKMPEDNTMELKIGLSDNAVSIQQGLFEQLAAVTKIQKERIERGEAISSVQRIGISTDDIIDVEAE